MAASVLLLVNSTDVTDTTTIGTDTSTTTSASTKLQSLIDTIVTLASQLQPGTASGQLGPVIDEVSYNKITSYIEYAIKDGAKVLLDGRTWDRRRSPNGSSSSSSSNNNNNGGDGGNWIGPTILLHTNSTDRTMCEEVFGPVLSIYQCSAWMEAIQIENNSPYGNAASIYTTNGGHAQYFLSHCKAAMLGCNIGIPVPREPFSFGGLYGTKSKYGSYTGDITGDAAIEFFTNRIKITSKWPNIDPTIYNNTANTTTSISTKKQKVVSTNGDDGIKSATATIDHANFAGRM
jgi:malonate-semialdehyde dehydrogenase (acetylating) / methylmalonate-semialdehyde dehydrogenase